MCSAAVLHRGIGSSPEVEWPSGAVFRGHAAADIVSAQNAEIIQLPRNGFRSVLLH